MGHFYYLDEGEAKPLWEVPYADKKRAGEMRPATLADAKKVNGKPSPNTAMEIHSKPGLIRWSDNLLLEAALDAPVEADGGLKAFKAEVFKLHKELKSVAADDGTAIHAEIEEAVNAIFIEGAPSHVTQDKWEWPRQVEAAVGWLYDGGGAYIEIDGVEEHFVNKEYGFGGMIDIVGWSTRDAHRPVIVDWKSTVFKPGWKGYPKDKLPLLAAYAMGYCGTLEVDCWNVFLDRDSGNEFLPTLYTDKEIQWGWRKFLHCYELWVMEKDFDPRETK